MTQTFIIIFCTVPDAAIADKIARSLVSNHLAACCNIVSGINSVYYWKGKLCRDDELLLIIKSAESKFDAIREKIIDLHPYEVPEIISLPISKGDSRYLKWIKEQIDGC